MPSDTSAAGTHTLLKQVLKATFIVVWVILAAEFYLRIFFPQALVPRYIKAADYGIRVNMPNQNYWHRTPDYEVNIRTNSAGIRADEEIPYDKPDGVKRIIVLGDSFGMGYGVDSKDTFLAVMKRELERAGIKTQIVNLSVAGHGTAEELITLSAEGVKYKPDLVLTIWHRTDPDDNIRSNLFQIQDEEIIRKSRSYLPAVKVREFLFRYSAYRWLAGNSHLYNWARMRVAKLSKKLLVKIRMKKKSNKHRELSATVAMQKNTGPHGKIKLSLALLEEIKRVARSNGARLLILDVPSQLSRTKFISTFPSVNNHYLGDFEIVNPIEEFKSHKGELLYWERSAGHFTPGGCKLVGKLLANRIIETQMLAKD